MQNNLTRVILLVTRTLEQIGITYAIGGSFASSLYGVVRATLDVDIVADVRREHIPRLIAALQTEFYIDETMIREAISQRSSFNLIHYPTSFKVDVFLLKERPFERSQLARRRATAIETEPEASLYVISPEDTVLAKLEWYRMGGEVSERQWRDIIGVLQVRVGDLDLPYLHHMAKTLNVSDLLEQALQEAAHDTPPSQSQMNQRRND